MKKFLIALLLLFAMANAKMVWVGFNPTPMKSDATGSTVATNLRDDLLAGQIISTVVVGDSAADSTYGTWYSYPINTQDVVSATGLIELMSVSDTSDLFEAMGDSSTVGYALKTGYIPYDTAALDLALSAAASITTVSATRAQTAITFALNDTLFKPWTWFEVTIRDTTGWVYGYSQDWCISASCDSAATIGGTYADNCGYSYYTYWIHDDTTGDPDSFCWTHEDPCTTTTGGPTAITGSAQNLDSGMTITFDATDGNGLDTFMFIAHDSLLYGRQVDFTIRMGLNIHKRCEPD